MRRRRGNAKYRAPLLLECSKFRSDSQNGTQIGYPILASMCVQHGELSDRVAEAIGCGSAERPHHLMHEHGLSHRLHELAS